MTAFRALSLAAVVAAHVVGAVSAAPQRSSNRDPVALAAAGTTALQEQRYGDAFEAFSEAAALAPRDASPSLGAGIAAMMLGRNADAHAWLDRTIALQPTRPDAYVYLGRVLYREGNVAKAVEAYETALKYAPQEERIQAQLDTWRKELRTQESFYQAQGAHFSVLFDGPSDDALARRAVEILEVAYFKVGSALTTYPARPIQVVLYTREQFRDLTRAPSWGGGVYDGRIKLPTRGALDRPEDLERLLTHEFVHAVVASIAGRTVPTWLNEGLATVFEPGGLDWTAQQLQRDPARLPHAALEDGFGDLSNAHARIAYAQSAAAVKKILDLRGAPAVVVLLQSIGRGAPFAGAFQQAISMRYEDFITMVSRE